jgi:hypothetical protein
MGELVLFGTIAGGVALATVAARFTLWAMVTAMPVGHKARAQVAS